MDSATKQPENVGEKAAYEAPEITVLGTIEEVTKGGHSNSTDSGTSSNP